LKIIDTEAPAQHFPSALGPFCRVLARIGSLLAAVLRLTLLVGLCLSSVAARGLWPAELRFEALKGPLEIRNLHCKVLLKTFQTTQVPEALVVLVA